MHSKALILSKFIQDPFKQKHKLHSNSFESFQVYSNPLIFNQIHAKQFKSIKINTNPCNSILQDARNIYSKQMQSQLNNR